MLFGGFYLNYYTFFYNNVYPQTRVNLYSFIYYWKSDLLPEFNSA